MKKHSFTKGLLAKWRAPSLQWRPVAGTLSRLGLFAVILFVAASCGSPPDISSQQSKDFKHKPLIWPSPPAPARIAFDLSLAKPEDIGIKKGLLTKFVDILVGADKRSMVKPYGIAVDTSGRVLVADTAARKIHIYDRRKKKYLRIDRAGKTGLESPIGVATDSMDNIYVTDSLARKVYVFNAKGSLLRSIDGGTRPTGLTVDTARKRLYVVDTGEHKIRIFSLEGKPLSTFGGIGSKPGEFNYPMDVFVDGRGDLYVTDSMNYRVQIFDMNGRYLSSFGQHGDGSGDFGRPKGIAVDSEGNIYVADAIFDTVQIFSRKGVFLLSFGSLGSGPGKFWMPGGVFIDGSDNIFVADPYNRRVEVFEYLGGGNEVPGPRGG
ncbi:MAG: 6-bladed beta-propeller [Thermodesulfobacteriota bacterium]